MINKILISITAGLLLASTAQAKDDRMIDFLSSALQNNPNISNVQLKKNSEKKIEGLKGWKAESITISATVDRNGQKKDIHESDTYFTNGRFITSNMTDMRTGNSITLEKKKEDPKFLKKYYIKKDILFGNPNAKHKVVIFSDPLCPFCRKYVPKMLRALKKHKNEYVVYYYDLPLTTLHPASKTLSEIGIYLRKVSKNKFENTLKLYGSNVYYREENPEKIISSFNDQYGTNINLKDIQKRYIKKDIKDIEKIADSLDIHGTPTFIVDGKKIIEPEKFYNKVK